MDWQIINSDRVSFRYVRAIAALVANWSLCEEARRRDIIWYVRRIVFQVLNYCCDANVKSVGGTRRRRGRRREFTVQSVHILSSIKFRLHNRDSLDSRSNAIPSVRAWKEKNVTSRFRARNPYFFHACRRVDTRRQGFYLRSTPHAHLSILILCSLRLTVVCGPVVPDVPDFCFQRKAWERERGERESSVIGALHSVCACQKETKKERTKKHDL